MLVEKDIEDVGIVLRPMTNPLVMGSVKVEGDDVLPTPLPRIVIKYPSGTVAGRYEINQRGLFFFSASLVEFTVSLEDLKESYFVKSIMWGSQDITRNPLKRTDPAVMQPITITLGRK